MGPYQQCQHPRVTIFSMTKRLIVLAAPVVVLAGSVIIAAPAEAKSQGKHHVRCSGLSFHHSKKATNKALATDEIELGIIKSTNKALDIDDIELGIIR